MNYLIKSRLLSTMIYSVVAHICVVPLANGMKTASGTYLFLKKFFGPILGPLVPLFWISDDDSSGFSKPEWVLPYSHCGGKCNVHSLRSTSGATHCQPLGQTVIAGH